MILEAHPSVQELSTEHKIRLMLELAEEAYHHGDLPDEILRELDQRLDIHEADPDAVKSTAEVTKGIMSIKNRLNQPGA